MTKPKDENYWIYGKHSVASALNNPARRVFRVISTADNAHLVKNFQGNLKIMNGKEITKEIGLLDAVHQGIAAYVSSVAAHNLTSLISELKLKSKSIVVMLDQITDPNNIGAIIRSAAAFHADAVILPKNNSPAESGAMSKASAGMVDIVPLVYITSLAAAIAQLKDIGFWVVGLDGEAKESIAKAADFDKIVLVLGSEGEGMRRLTAELCDFLVKINIAEAVESLNVSNAAAITLYEINNSRNIQKN
jgi:23S rRNA (guanosine2251-2'-O)-methyltransferase